MTDKSRLLRLLVLLQSHAIDAPPPTSEEAMERAGFVRQEPAPPVELRIAFRRMWAFIEEREAKRQLREKRKLRLSLSAVPGTDTEPENGKSAASTAVGRDVR